MTIEVRRAKNAEKSRKYRLLHADNARRIDKKSKSTPWSKERKREYMRAYQQNNREAVRARQIKSKYGLTSDMFASLLESQFGACAICAGPPHPVVRNVKRQGVVPQFVVDHDHSTGAIRGLLCHSCNSMLGMAKDSPANLRSAAHYLEKRRGAN